MVFWDNNLAFNDSVMFSKWGVKQNVWPLVVCPTETTIFSLYILMSFHHVFALNEGKILNVLQDYASSVAQCLHLKLLKVNDLLVDI